MSIQNEQITDFRVADAQGYILRRGYLATARLNLQHFLWQRILNFTVQKSINLPDNAIIADIATGSALWAMDVADELPTARIHGFDIDTTQGPPPEWLPANIKISEWDILHDPPAEYIESFDLVHVQLLVLVLSGHDPLPFIQRLRLLLKPGGWLQWEDLDCTKMHVNRVEPGVKSPNLDAIIEMSRSSGRHDWVARLMDMVTSEGFADAKSLTYDDPTKLCRALNDQHLMTMEEFAMGLLKSGKKEAADGVLKMVQEGYKESLAGAAICYPRVCCIARKPS